MFFHFCCTYCSLVYKLLYQQMTDKCPGRNLPCPGPKLFALYSGVPAKLSTVCLCSETFCVSMQDLSAKSFGDAENDADEVSWIWSSMAWPHSLRAAFRRSCQTVDSLSVFPCFSKVLCIHEGSKCGIFR